MALITGADSGIDELSRIAFAREGADVALSYLPEEQQMRRHGIMVRDAGGKALLLPGDIQRGSLPTMVDRAFAELGTIDILVNNAAFQTTHDTIDEFTTEELDRTSVRISTPFWLCRRRCRA